MRYFRTSALALIVAGSLATPAAQASPIFNLTFISGTDAQAITSFQTAANFWSSKFSNNVTLSLTVGTGALGSGILAQTDSGFDFTSYASFKSALTSNATSAIDLQAVADLSPGNSFSSYINYTADNPNGNGSATPYVSSGTANDSFIGLTSANAKALGLTTLSPTVTACGGSCDGFIEFSNAFTYDYDRSNGITGGAFDFTGLAIHELGHALGFVSGVDVLDTNSTGTFYPASDFTYVAPLDMFRCSAASAAAGASIDFTADARTKTFSLDHCATSLASFSTGSVHGDGRQASHWKDNLGLGIMDPTAAPGELLTATALDLTAFDVIGWNLASVPEPGSLAFAAVWGLALLFGRRLRNG
jgi:hypothetical protein